MEKKENEVEDRNQHVFGCGKGGEHRRARGTRKRAPPGAVNAAGGKAETKKADRRAGKGETGAEERGTEGKSRREKAGWDAALEKGTPQGAERGAGKRRA